MALKVFSSRKTTRKVCAVEVPMGGGSKRENSLGAPKWTIHVKTLLNDLLKLIKVTFYLLGLGLSDLKGDCGSIFGVLLVWPGFWCFCPLTSHSARGSQFWEGEGKLYKKVFNGPISSLVSVVAVPRGGEGHEKINPAVPP
jgi:hypothetical protein